MHSLRRSTPEISVAVLGLPLYDLAASERCGGRLCSGVGKTDLCRRFALPSVDEFVACSENVDRYARVSAVEFCQNREINSSHYLYYGRTVRVYEEQPVVFHVVEHTTFTDEHGEPHGGGVPPYSERAVASLSRPAKLACVQSRGKEQSCRFPCRAFSSGPDAFVFVIDCSTTHQALDDQLQLAEDVFDRLKESGKPMVIAFSKCDLIGAPRLQEVRRRYYLLSVLPCFEFSSITGVGVDQPFFHLFTASRKAPNGFAGIMQRSSFRELTRVRELTVNRAWREFQTLLADERCDLSTRWCEFVEHAGRNLTLAALLCLCGRQKLIDRFRQHLLRLKIAEMERRLNDIRRDFRQTLTSHPDLNPLLSENQELEK